MRRCLRDTDMKLLHFITSCKRDRYNGANMVCRDTWLKQWGHRIDHKFIIGHGNEDILGDELYVDVPDDFGNVVHKERQAYIWALGCEYDFVYISSPDCYRIIPRMLASGFERHDYVGSKCPGENHAGGCGYWLSSKAIDAMLRQPVIVDYPDRAAGRALAQAGIPLIDDPRYWGAPGQNGGAPFNPATPGIWDTGIVGVNLGRGTGCFNPKWMYDCHAQYMLSEGL